MALLDFAKRELDLVGMTEDNPDEMNQMMRKHILHMVEEFSDEGHSGFSAAYAINILEKLLRFEPLTPLTGSDEEWNRLDYSPDDMKSQNKRCSHVFKGVDGRAYDSEGIIFYDWVKDEETGQLRKSHFTGSGSRVYIEFPYVPTREYRERDE